MRIFLTLGKDVAIFGGLFKDLVVCFSDPFGVINADKTQSGQGSNRHGSLPYAVQFRVGKEHIGAENAVRRRFRIASVFVAFNGSDVVFTEREHAIGIKKFEILSINCRQLLDDRGEGWMDKGVDPGVHRGRNDAGKHSADLFFLEIVLGGIKGGPNHRQGRFPELIIGDIVYLLFQGRFKVFQRFLACDSFLIHVIAKAAENQFPRVLERSANRAGNGAKQL